MLLSSLIKRPLDNLIIKHNLEWTKCAYAVGLMMFAKFYLPCFYVMWGLATRYCRVQYRAIMTRKPLSKLVAYNSLSRPLSTKCFSRKSQLSDWKLRLSFRTAEIQRIIVCPLYLRVTETWRLLVIPSSRKPRGYTSLRNAFPRSRSRGKVTYTRVSRFGYLNFR